MFRAGLASLTSARRFAQEKRGMLGKFKTKHDRFQNCRMLGFFANVPLSIRNEIVLFRN